MRCYKFFLYTFLVCDIIVMALYLWLMIFGNSVAPTTNYKPQTTHSASSPQLPTQIVSQAPKKQYQRLIDGVMVNKELVNQPLFAVLLDNLVEPSGLDKASVVYETLVEGGITRFMALFPISNYQLSAPSSSEPTLPPTSYKLQATSSPFAIGSVRSVRPYFVDWAQEVGATLVYVGGSDEALSKIETRDIKSLNEFYKGEYFYRDQNHNAPHHIFTSTDLLATFLRNSQSTMSMQAERGNPENDLEPWQFVDHSTTTDSVLKDIASFTVPFARTNIVEWMYDKTTGDYTRHPYSYIKAKNVVVQYTNISVIDDVGRLKIKTKGVGKAKIFLDGRQINGKWIKLKTGRTKFYDQSGNEIKFNRGVTWIEVVKS